MTSKQNENPLERTFSIGVGLGKMTSKLNKRTFKRTFTPALEEVDDYKPRLRYFDKREIMHLKLMPVCVNKTGKEKKTRHPI